MSFMSISDFSEERMAAFIDGMLSPEEMDAFQKEMDNNPVLKSIYHEINNDTLDQGASAIDDFPGLQPEATMSSIIPTIHESLLKGSDLIDGFCDIPLPPPVFEDETGSTEDTIDSMLNQNNDDNSVSGEADGLTGEAEMGDLDLEN